MAKIDAFFNLMFEQKASDLHMASGNPPMMRIHGELQRVDFPPLESDALKAMLYEIAPDYKIKLFEETGDVDFGYEIPNISRFRVNFFNQKNGVAAVFRQIPSRVLSFEDFDKLETPLPPVFKKFAMLHRGLVVVTGPTGSGKSTTLAAIVDYANRNRKDHIITIEDPIEFVHESKNCLVNHREVGVHTKSFASALRGALREDPDIILVGEMRDLETIELAITAAATGHLVFGTLHTQSAAKTVDRIIDVFPADQQNKIRQTLSEALKGVVAQTLFKRSDKKGRVAAFEILVFNTAVANLVREGKTHQIQGMIQVGKKYGNQQLDDHILEHVRMKRVTPEDAYDKALDKKKFKPLMAHPPDDDDAIQFMRRAELDLVLTTILASQPEVSDVLFTVDRPPQVEAYGELKPVVLDPPINKLTPYQIETIAMNIIGDNAWQLEDLVRHGSCDASYALGDKARFRVNVFSQRGNYSIVCRQLNATIPSLEQLKLPDILKELPKEKTGLVLVTGATGSGKSTTLAAVLNEINRYKAVHVVTLEDPVEYLHQHNKSTFNQRELGVDFDSYANGLRAALRQAPKVILVGEMRDRETVQIALSAAETGHLVLSTLHTINAGETINRILGMFEPDEQEQVRLRLADSLRWVVSQRLAPKLGGARTALIEIMGANLRTEEAIRLGESEGKSFYEIIEASYTFGWRTFDQACLDAYEEGLISEETALLYCTKRSIVARGIDNSRKAHGEMNSTAGSLRMKSGPANGGAATATIPPPILKFK